MALIHERDSTRLRAGFRGVLPAVATLVLFLGGGTLLGILLGSATEAGSNEEVLLGSIAQLVFYTVLIGVTVWGAAKLEHRKYTDFGLNIDMGWIRNFAVGTTITLLGISVSLWWADLRGIRDFTLTIAGVTGPQKPLLLAVVLLLFVFYFLLDVVWQELLYRRIMLGNFMQGLAARGVSPRAAAVPATAVSLLLFGAYHIPFRGNLLVALDAALVGIPFALAFLLTGKLALPAGIHFGRVLIEFLHGLTRGEFHVIPIVEITQNTLPANLELKLLRIGLICLYILAWIYLNHGEIRMVETIYHRNGK
jgi:membrane protease YdiL (CAAX protease family)